MTAPERMFVREKPNGAMGRWHDATSLPETAAMTLDGSNPMRPYILATPEALAASPEVQALIEAATASLRVQIEALSSPPDFEEGANIGFALGVDDCRKKVAAAETRAWNAAIEAACKVALEWAKAPFVGDLTLPDEYIRALKKGE